MRYKLAVYIGRFQPFHVGHAHAIDEALKIANNVLVLVGSSSQARTAKNPFTYDERYKMIKQGISGRGYSARVDVAPIQDHPYQEHEWIAEVQSVVKSWIYGTNYTDDDIVLVGHAKDESSYYLKVFPQWDQVDTGLGQPIDATQLREYLFTDEFHKCRGLVHPYNYEDLCAWRTSDEFKNIQEEWLDILDYKLRWSKAPYAPTFVTVDSVVVQSGHVLLVRRGKSPGRGLWALPGGFVEPNERLIDASLRELVEETSIKLQPDTIRRCFRDVRVFDAPGRDLRGRCFTHAHLYALNDAVALPKVRGADDAMEAAWVKLADLSPEQMYSDHYHIIQTMLGKL